LSDSTEYALPGELRRFKEYPEYTDSGVEWLGEIPTRWEVVPLKRVATIQNGADHKHIDVNEGYPVIGSGGPFAFASDFMYDGESVLLGRKGTVDKPLYVNGRFWTVDTMYWTKILEGVSARFVYYAALTIPFDFYSTNTALPSMTQSALGNHAIAVPSPHEQRAITSFLDRETARIDALVAKKERLITLLQERRIALITRAVTKGLDLAVPMKDSGVEWLGEIPAHWDLLPSTWLFTESKQRFLEGDEQLSATQKYGVIPQAEFERLEGRQVVHALMHLDQRKHVEVDDFVMSMRSFEGGLERVRVRGCVRSSYGVLRSSSRVHISYFAHLFKSSTYIQALRATSNFIRDGQDLSYQNFRLVRLPLPPLPEQVACADFLDRETERIDHLVAKIDDVLRRLHELRTALISAAVTGKIDVREAAQ